MKKKNLIRSMMSALRKSNPLLIESLTQINQHEIHFSVRGCQPNQFRIRLEPPSFNGQEVFVEGVDHPWLSKINLSYGRSHHVGKAERKHAVTLLASSLFRYQMRRKNHDVGFQYGWSNNQLCGSILTNEKVCIQTVFSV